MLEEQIRNESNPLKKLELKLNADQADFSKRLEKDKDRMVIWIIGLFIGGFIISSLGLYQLAQVVFWIIRHV